MMSAKTTHPAHAEDRASPERLVAIVDDLSALLHETIRRHRPTRQEYQVAIAFLAECAAHREIGMLGNVLGLSAAIERIHDDGADAGTPTNTEGPFYRAGAPLRSGSPPRLCRADEPGVPLALRGRVHSSAGGSGLAGALLDLWQANANGNYEHFDDEPQPEWNLRGRIRADANGEFEVLTILPPAYEISRNGPVGRLLRAVGRHAFRPAHLHVKISADGHEPLTTQLYVGQRYNASDAINGYQDALHAPTRAGAGDVQRSDFTFALKASTR